jgi:hypothetical protein
MEKGLIICKYTKKAWNNQAFLYIFLEFINQNHDYMDRN